MPNSITIKSNGSIEMNMSLNQTKTGEISDI